MRQIPCAIEEHFHGAAGSVLMQGDILDKREELLARYAGQVQTIYLDPPFYTQKTFIHKQRCGENGWRTGEPMLQLPAYSDQWQDAPHFLSLLREAILLAHALLREDGSLFLHIDARMHAQLRLMLDDIFGRQHFVNEIIWSYQSGGRATSHFSRKHDIILFYRKSKQAYFNIKAVGIKRAGARSNHMRRNVDAQGRAYRSIVSHGREYRYYDDEMVYPGDVWDDISHLQQKDPQRSGYDTQKPLKLLERILRCSTRPGDLVCDLFAGSGTTGVAACLHDRRFLLLDISPIALAVARGRLLGNAMRVEAPGAQGSPEVRARFQPGLGLTTMTLESYRLEAGRCDIALGGIEAVDQISAGYLRGDVFYAFESVARSRIAPQLNSRLTIPLLEGRPALLTVDVLGRRFVHVPEGEMNGRQI